MAERYPRSSGFDSDNEDSDDSADQGEHYCRAITKLTAVIAPVLKNEIKDLISKALCRRTGR